MSVARRWTGGPALLIVTLVMVLTGCATGPAGGPSANGLFGGSPSSGSVDGTFVEFAPEERGAPIQFAGISETGVKISSDDYAGQVLAVNFWYAACGPCRAEAPDLQNIYLTHEGAGASFLGVNVYDQAETALAFARKYEVTYPSLLDAGSGAVRLAFAGVAAPSAVPTTIVLDKQGRVAARFLGQIMAPSSLETVVRELIAEEL